MHCWQYFLRGIMVIVATFMLAFVIFGLLRVLSKYVF